MDHIEQAYIAKVNAAIARGDESCAEELGAMFAAEPHHRSGRTIRLGIGFPRHALLPHRR